jgi:D-3-phosphoglycerate dehydrogenase
MNGMTDSKIVIAVGQTFPDLNIEQSILARSNARIVDGRGFSPQDPTWAAASGILLGTAHKLDAARLRTLPNCKAVVRYGLGYDNVDVRAAEECGIIVAIVRDYCIDEVAEHTVASALCLARGLLRWDKSVRAGAWRGREKFPMHRLSNLTFAMLGYGLIGRVVAKKAEPLFGRILIHDPWATISTQDRASGVSFAETLDEMLGVADIVSVHVPLTKQTRGLLDKRRLELMKPTAFVINVSRGGIVDEKALLEAVSSGRLAGAALDTFEQEPLPADHPFVREPKILLSPHVAWLSEEAEVKLRESATREMALILDGKQPSSPVTAAQLG